MKKYFYLLIYVLLYILSAVLLIQLCVNGLNYNIIIDIKKITSFILVICSLEWILFGFLYNKKLQHRMKEMTITIIIITVLLLFISQSNWSILDVRLLTIPTLSFTGLFWKSLLEGNSLGAFAIPVYLFYYIALFVLGVLLNMKVYKDKNNN